MKFRNYKLDDGIKVITGNTMKVITKTVVSVRRNTQATIKLFFIMIRNATSGE
jgi:hypothetical protein